MMYVAGLEVPGNAAVLVILLSTVAKYLRKATEIKILYFGLYFRGFESTTAVDGMCHEQEAAGHTE